MSGDRENNRRRRTPSESRQPTSMLTNIINNVTTCLIRRINVFRDFYMVNEFGNDSESHHDSESGEHAPPPPKRRCNRTGSTNDPDQPQGSSEIPTNRNLPDVYPSTSTANRKRDRTVMSAPLVTRSTTDEENDIDWSSSRPSNIQHSQNRTFTLDNLFVNTRRRRVMNSQEPGPSGIRMNHYKTKNLALPSQATILHVKNSTRSQTTPMITCPAESEVTPEPSRPEENSPPIVIASVSTVHEPMDELMAQENVSLREAASIK